MDRTTGHDVVGLLHALLTQKWTATLFHTDDGAHVLVEVYSDAGDVAYRLLIKDAVVEG